MKLIYTIRDGIITAAALMSFRFLLAAIANWPGYSWPEIGCLFVASELFGLGESMWVHVFAPTVVALVIGAIIATTLNTVPNLGRMRPWKFRLTLCLTEMAVLLLPIVLLPVKGWI
jgi:hypothetical protein